MGKRRTQNGAGITNINIYKKGTYSEYFPSMDDEAPSIEEYRCSYKSDLGKCANPKCERYYQFCTQKHSCSRWTNEKKDIDFFDVDHFCKKDERDIFRKIITTYLCNIKLFKTADFQNKIILEIFGTGDSDDAIIFRECLSELKEIKKKDFPLIPIIIEEYSGYWGEERTYRNYAGDNIEFVWDTLEKRNINRILRILLYYCVKKKVSMISTWDRSNRFYGYNRGSKVNNHYSLEEIENDVHEMLRGYKSLSVEYKKYQQIVKGYRPNYMTPIYIVDSHRISKDNLIKKERICIALVIPIDIQIDTMDAYFSIYYKDLLKKSGHNYEEREQIKKQIVGKFVKDDTNGCGQIVSYENTKIGVHFLDFPNQTFMFFFPDDFENEKLYFIKQEEWMATKKEIQQYYKKKYIGRIIRYKQYLLREYKLGIIIRYENNYLYVKNIEEGEKVDVNKCYKCDTILRYPEKEYGVDIEFLK